MLSMNEAERWLKDWHDRHFGATSRLFARGRPSSYEWLAACARPADRVLDLACGDGLLLELVRAQTTGEVVGVDLSEGELAAARARLGDGARLVQARAQALPLPDGSFDLVTSHLALMLMDPVDEVIAEVRRVLCQGGRFAAIVQGAGASRDDAWTRLIQHIVSTPLTGPTLGDPRTYTGDGLRALLGAFNDVQIEPLSVDLSGTVDDMWTLFAGTYLFEQVPAAHFGALEAAVRADWHALLRPDGTVPCTFELLAVVATR